MACGPCGGARDGYRHVWQLRAVGSTVKEFASQHEANLEREKNGGRGVVLKVTVKDSGG